VAPVLAFTSAPLPADVEVLGAPAVEVAHGSDNPHVDVFARISEVGARGRSRPREHRGLPEAIRGHVHGARAAGQHKA
jgi:predicted acyl esterase